MNSSLASLSSSASTVKVTNPDLTMITNAMPVMNEMTEAPATDGSLENENELRDTSSYYTALLAIYSLATNALSTLESTNSSGAARPVVRTRGVNGADDVNGAATAIVWMVFMTFTAVILVVFMAVIVVIVRKRL